MSARSSDDRPGIDRRTLIRRAAVTGAVAWTAPVIIGSLTSPAAAITGIVGCTGMLFNGGNCNLEHQGTPCSFTLCDDLNAGALQACVELSGDCQNGPLTISIALGCQPACKITNASAKSGSACIFPTPNPNPAPVGPPPNSPQTSVTFPAAVSPGYAQHAINVVCV